MDVVGAVAHDDSSEVGVFELFWKRDERFPGIYTDRTTFIFVFFDVCEKIFGPMPIENS